MDVSLPLMVYTFSLGQEFGFGQLACSKPPDRKMEVLVSMNVRERMLCRGNHLSVTSSHPGGDRIRKREQSTIHSSLLKPASSPLEQLRHLCDRLRSGAFTPPSGKTFL